MEIQVNGETWEVAEGITVSGLLQHAGVSEKTVVVQRNDDMVPRSGFGDTVLQPGDIVELVQFVGGG